VGSQPFGGEGLSGTGPKAGGPDYMPRFTSLAPAPAATGKTTRTDPETVQRLIETADAGDTALDRHDLPGPTGETNRLSLHPRAPILCLGPDAPAQAAVVRALGGRAVEAEGLPPEALETLSGFGGAIWWGDADRGRALALALSRRGEAILPLVTAMPDRGHVMLERHLCIDTTASGGNAALLAEAAA